jgi:hypothetical protein
VISHVGATVRKFLEQPVVGRLPFIIYVGFVGKAEYKNPTAFYCFALVIEGLRNTVNDVVWHGGIDLAGQLNSLAFQVK